MSSYDLVEILKGKKTENIENQIFFMLDESFSVHDSLSNDNEIYDIITTELMNMKLYKGTFKLTKEDIIREAKENANLKSLYSNIFPIFYGSDEKSKNACKYEKDTIWTFLYYHDDLRNTTQDLDSLEYSYSTEIEEALKNTKQSNYYEGLNPFEIKKIIDKKKVAMEEQNFFF